MSAAPSGGPLAGLRVVELPAIGPIPFCGMQLADMGADVVRIDRLTAADLGIGISPRYDVLNRGKRSIALDLKQAGGRDIALRMATRADLLIEGFRPGVAERLGLGPTDCHARNRRLIYGRISGFGRSGPHATRAGHDIGYLALSGVLAATGPAAEPIPPLNLVGDFGGAAMALTAGLLGALYARGTDADGQVVDCSILGGATALTPMLHGLRAAGRWSLSRADNVLDGGAPYYRCYATQDAGFMAVGAIESRFYAALLERLGLAEELGVAAQNDRARWPEFSARIAAVFATRTREQWRAHFEGSDACCEPVLNLDEAPAHPQALANAAFVTVGGVTQPAPFPVFDATPAGVPDAAPTAGQHDADVLDEIGVDARERAALSASGAIGPTHC